MASSTGARRYRTPDQILGPYFPTGQTPVPQADLTTVGGAEGLAQGEIIEVTGKILNLAGDPIRGVPVTIWQANSFDRYVHVNDPNPAPLDPYFVGCVGIRSDDNSTGSRPSSPGPIPQVRTGCGRRIFISKFTGGSSGSSLRRIFPVSRSMPATGCSTPPCVRIC